MKRPIIKAALVGVLALLLAACNGGNGNGSVQGTPSGFVALVLSLTGTQPNDTDPLDTSSIVVTTDDHGDPIDR